MYTRTKAAFSTALRSKTSIWPGDVVRYDINGIYIRRPGDTALEKPGGQKYIIKSPGILSASQVADIAEEVAALIGLMMGLPIVKIERGAGGSSYRIGEAK